MDSSAIAPGVIGKQANRVNNVTNNTSTTIAHVGQRITLLHLNI